MEFQESVLSKFDLKGQVAIVTGGAGLLGRQFCKTLAQVGASVICADVDYQAAKSFSEELSLLDLTIQPFHVDVTKPEENHAMVDFSNSMFHRLDILVTSAALDPKFDDEHADQFDPPFVEYPLSLWQRALEINLTGVFLSAQACIPLMLKNQYGVLVLISSIYGMVAPDQ
jgi:NAD(P)-dependent dehydrogenase (short-subunit alcohol dehydrogenase family)